MATLAPERPHAPVFPGPTGPSPSHQLDLPQLVGLARDVAADRARWEPRVRFGTAGRRWWTRLHGDDCVDVWLLTWLPGHTTDLHDHGDSSAAFVVVRGELEEVRADRPDAALSSSRLAAGSAAWVAPGVIHDVRAHGDVPAVSIHAYSSPLTRMTYWERALPGSVLRSVAGREPEHEEAS